MKFDYQVNFNLQDCLKGLGLNERGRVQQVVTNEVLRLSDAYVPFDKAGIYEQPGRLRDSGHIENETDIVWETPYARRLYYHPEYNFQGKPKRGGNWVDRMLQNGGRTEIEKAARREVAR